MTITRNFKLCLNAGTQNAPYINANQYDEGEQWIFDLYTEGGQKFTPSTGAIIGIKSDGNAILNSGTVNSDGQVVITETQQMTAASGLAVFELLIEGETHGTANFIVNVERRPSDDAEFSDSDLSMLQEAIDSAAEIEDLLDGQDVPTVITPIISDWLDDNITNPSSPPIDTSLTVAGAAADAKKTGDEITDLKSAITDGYVTCNTFVQGARSTDISVADIAIRCTISRVFELHEGDKIAVKNIDNGLRVAVAGVANGAFVYDSGWQTTDHSYTVPSGNDGTYFVNVSKTDNSNITPSDIGTLVVMMTPLTSISKMENTIKTLSATADDFKAYAVHKNYFNGQVHSGIHSQTNGDNYGTYSENANYFYTDLIEITERLFVFSNFIGSPIVYITFFNENEVIIGKQNGYNPMIDSFPTGAKYFCVCTTNANASTLIVSDVIPDKYYDYSTYETAITTNKAAATTKRLDKGIVSGYYVGASNGSAIYPLTAGNLITSYPFSVKNMSAVSYRNNSGYYPQLVFADKNGNKISDAPMSAYSTGTITIPSGAEIALYYASNFDAESLLTIVEGAEAPSEIYPYDAISITGLYYDSDNNLHDKKLVFVGDSITAGSNYHGGWVNLIQTEYNCFCTNAGHDGWTIGILPNRTDNLLGLLPTLGDDFDIVVLSGGYNDFTTTPRAEIGEITPYTYSELDTSTFCGSLESYLRTARTKWINSKICFILTMRKEFTDTTVNERQLTYWNLIRQACKKYAIPVLDLYENSALVGVVVEGVTDLVTTTYYHNADGTHPNQLGYAYLTPQIASFLMAL